MSFVLLGILNAQAAGGGAGETFELIQTVELTSAQSEIEFTGLDSLSEFKHLHLRYSCKVNGSSSGINWRFNNWSGANYSRHFIRINPSGGATGSSTNLIQAPFGKAGDTTANKWAVGVTEITNFNKGNRTTVRNFTGVNADSSAELWFASNGWGVTDPFSSIQFRPASFSWDTGTRISLYGIRG